MLIYYSFCYCFLFLIIPCSSCLFSLMFIKYLSFLNSPSYLSLQSSTNMVVKPQPSLLYFFLLLVQILSLFPHSWLWLYCSLVFNFIYFLFHCSIWYLSKNEKGNSAKRIEKGEREMEDEKEKKWEKRIGLLWLVIDHRPLR